MPLETLEIMGDFLTMNQSSSVNVYKTYMNVTMSDAIFTNPRGQHYLFESFFLMNRQIRYFHIPEEMDIIPAIKKQIEKLGKKDDTYRRVQRKK
ncbi:uncharacterized protein LOC126355441 isoform X2 [Schistocerca gregaria]|uniref:uncharacterized protein LOC126355441 isoform X2 n=1 Tax=Schistocerca gregaria TaxID=7010 RepID=UPI00211F2E7E|nr:uncharacterized protein LOC126355441 isoform X2 [Schistocerca gregaria]